MIVMGCFRWDAREASLRGGRQSLEQEGATDVVRSTQAEGTEFAKAVRELGICGTVSAKGEDINVTVYNDLVSWRS